MFDLLRGLFQRQRVQTIYECRQCGRTLEDETEACPQCGWVGIAVYELEE